jgi:hypothetical protein
MQRSKNLAFLTRSNVAPTAIGSRATRKVIDGCAKPTNDRPLNVTHANPGASSDEF